MLEVSYLNAAFNTSSAPCLVIDAQSITLNIIDVNIAYTTACNTFKTVIKGTTFNEFINNNIFISSEDKTLLIASLQQAIETGKAQEFVVNNYFNNHTSYSYTALQQPVTNNQGDVLYVIHTVTANANHLHTRNLLQDQEYLFLETISDGFLILSKDFVVLYSNRRFEKIWNIGRNEIIGKNLWDYFDKKEYMHIYEYYMDALNTNTVKCIESFSEQLQSWYEITVYPFDAGLSVYFKDITERKEAIERETFLASIISSSDDGIISKTLDGIITTWNKGAETIFGYTSEEAIGKNIGLIIPKELYAAEEPSILLRIKNGEHIKHYETNRVTKSGHSISVSITVSPIKNANGKIIGASKILRNITDKKRTEFLLKEKNLALTKSTNELEILNQSLQKQTKALMASNAELEQFAYVASHDLQEPLRMVTSFLTQLNSKYENVLDDKGKKYIAFAVDGAIRMRQIILDLLEFSRIGRIENSLETVDIMALIKRIEILLLKEIEEKQAKILYNNLPSIISFAVPLHQVLQNLISNALKYCHPDKPPIVTITTKDIDNYWQFEITDNGIGIESEYFEKIFIIFQRLHTKEAYSGTGMGLAITKKIIENWGGKIWLTSIENKGTTFYFTIPKHC